MSIQKTAIAIICTVFMAQGLAHGAVATTVSQQNAIAEAKSYLRVSDFSRQGLIDQLSSSVGGFSVSDAQMAVDSLNIDWNAEAVKSAKGYLRLMAFSCQGMIHQLASPAGGKFTQAQAEYGATNAGLCSGSGSTGSGQVANVSVQNAASAAKTYLQVSAFSRQGLIDQLSSSAGDKYDVNDARAAVDSLNVDWNEQAVQSAKSYLSLMSFSCQGMIQQLASPAGAKFTQAQAEYGARKAGICS
ncbi:Ltp family lipoprotein [Asticcacaulis sp. 201]|uniref:Ltp family lipoprotein n=1 Tax=Asticcacaulis sp. 201 TaxID=3028787 RepID=UPI002917001C|nr:Ltp family lipoprotein [Asticcacaulis sp. 201]MDV6333243.1 Ltp family lipoprotein [Asticcacaulis sp. 201]